MSSMRDIEQPLSCDRKRYSATGINQSGRGISAYKKLLRKVDSEAGILSRGAKT